METGSEVPQLNWYSVKLYHPDEGAYCKNTGKSVRFQVQASSKPTLRTVIESSTNGFFNGDTCQQCGTLAKVSFNLSESE